jgi:hypothetical protein
MKIRMVALRRHYHGEDKKEYQAGEWFNVSSEREADRLVRMRRANRDVPKAAQKPPVKTRDMVAEQAIVAPTPEVFSPQVSEQAPAEPAPRRYRRSDMRSED